MVAELEFESKPFDFWFQIVHSQTINQGCIIEETEVGWVSGQRGHWRTNWIWDVTLASIWKYPKGEYYGASFPSGDISGCHDLCALGPEYQGKQQHAVACDFQEVRRVRKCGWGWQRRKTVLKMEQWVLLCDSTHAVRISPERVKRRL